MESKSFQVTISDSIVNTNINLNMLTFNVKNFVEKITQILVAHSVVVKIVGCARIIYNCI